MRASEAPPPAHSTTDGAVLTADTAHGGAGDHGTATEAEGGLPQFQFQHWGGQIAYLLILFVVLYILISKVFAPRLNRVMDERAATIAGALETARQVQAEAAGQAETAKAEVQKARADARAASVAAKARVTAEAERRAAAEEEVVNARIAEAETAIGKTRDAAMANVSAIAADTAAAIVERLTGKAPSAAETAAAVKGAA